MQYDRVDCRAVIALHAALVIGCEIASPVVARAQSESEPAAAALQVQSPAGCLESAAIQSQVHERSQRVTFVPVGPNVPLLNVELQRKSGRTLAVELRVSWPDKRRSRRRLAANSCEEATSAVAFLIALTLDPAAFVQSRGTPPAEPAATSGATQPPSAAGSAGAAGDRLPADTASPTVDASSAVVAAPAPTEPAATTESGSSDSEPFTFDHFSFGVSAQLTSGVAPKLMPGFGVHAMLALRGSGWFRPALQLTAAHVWVNALKEAGGIADFQRTTLRIDVCPIAIQAGSFTARACASTALGSLSAQGSESYLPKTSARGWFDLGASLLASVDLGPVFQVLAGFSLAAPLRRDEFSFHPDVFHRVAALCWGGHLGLGMRFP